MIDVNIVELITFGSDDPYPQLRGYDCREVRFVQHRHYNSETKEYDTEDEHTLQIQCPCCGGDGMLRGTISCDGGGGCDHDVEVECSTCECHGWCDLELQDDQVSFKFWFNGWGEAEPDEVTMPDFIVRKYLSYLDGWGGELADPNQLKMFEEKP